MTHSTETQRLTLADRKQILRIVADAFGTLGRDVNGGETVVSAAWQVEKKLRFQAQHLDEAPPLPAAPAPAETTKFMTCKTCGSAEMVSADARKCPGCGAPITETPGPQPVSEPARAAGDGIAEGREVGEDTSAVQMPREVARTLSAPLPEASGAKPGSSPVPTPPDAAQGKVALLGRCEKCSALLNYDGGIYCPKCFPPHPEGRAGELRECPFCQGTRTEIVFLANTSGAGRMVRCHDCLAEGPPKPEKSEAVAAWNRRLVLGQTEK